MLRFKVLFLALALLLASAPALADDLSGATRFICTASTVVICFDDGTCDTGTPGDFNIPQFVEVSLTRKLLSTTKASALNRSTPIASIRRDEGTLVLQGYENGRAFSYVIQEKSGVVAAAIASEGRNLAAFGACTPLTPSK